MKAKLFIIVSMVIGGTISFLVGTDADEIETSASSEVAKDQRLDADLAQDLINPDPARVLESSKTAKIASNGDALQAGTAIVGNEDMSRIDAASNLVKESLDIARSSGTAEKLVSYMEKNRFEARQALQGTEQYGERFEISAESTADPGSRVEANFNIMMDGSQEMQSIRSISQVSDMQAFEVLFKKMNKIMADKPGAELIEMTEATRRWVMPDGLAVWMKQSDTSDGKLRVAVATEYLP